MSKIQIPRELDKVFEALANEHRRDMVYVLGLQPHSISQLAAMRSLSLPAIHKHIKILKSAGLILDKKIGRSHFLTLNKEALKGLQDWLSQYNTYWGTADASLENYADYLSKKKLKGGEKK